MNIPSQKAFLKKRYILENDKVILELKLQSSKHLFDRKDPSPIKERDLNEDVVDYVVHSFTEIPSKYPVVVRVFLEESDEDMLLAQRIKASFSTFFQMEAFMKQQELRKTFQQGIISLLIGLSFLFLCIYATTLNFKKGLVSDFIIEGLTLLGWVSMWYPINIFLYDWWPIMSKKKQMLRISECEFDIRFGERGTIVS